MSKLFNLLSRILATITFKAYRQRKEAARRQSNYHFLKAKAVERHLAGFGGMVVNFPGKRFDSKDIACFRPPMYAFAKNQDGHWCLFWRKDLMSEEVGPPTAQAIPTTHEAKAELQAAVQSVKPNETEED